MEDLIKGVSLGAADTSSEFLKEAQESNSFLDELFTEAISPYLMHAKAQAPKKQRISSKIMKRKVKY